MTTRSLSVEEASEDAEVHDAMDGHDGVPLLAPFSQSKCVREHPASG